MSKVSNINNLILRKWVYNNIVYIILGNFNLNYYYDTIQLLNVSTGVSHIFNYHNEIELKRDYYLLNKYIQLLK